MDNWEVFEHDLAEELGIQRVPGSGSQWHSKLDIQGKGTRWSLKYTDEKGINLTRATLAEAILACGGIGGTGETPVWATRLNGMDDFVTMRLSDWKSFFMENNAFKIEQSKVQERRARAKTPQLMRED